MNLSAITVSFPIDLETYKELNELCEAAEKADLKSYRSVMNLAIAKSYDARGFFVLIYDDARGVLVGAASAVDLMGLTTYEWSILVDPMYRQLSVGEALINVLRDAFCARGSEGDLALSVDGGHFGAEFLLKNGYRYSFSDATLEAKAEVAKDDFSFTMRKFEKKDVDALVEIFIQGFGDTYEESLDLIAFNTSTEGLCLWVAERDGEVIGTVTTRKEGDAHWMTAFAVNPKFGGQGIGSEMLNWVKDYVLRSGENSVMLDVEIDNSRALYIYEKNGFMISSQVNYFVFVG